MEAFQPCSDTSDLNELSLHHHIYLKPEAKLSITVALPNVRLPGKTISNWEVMERLRQVAQPDEFQVIKVSKSTLEFIRFDAEIENRSQIRPVIGKLDGKVIRLSGFPEPLKIRAAEAKPEFPTRHDWDRYFRDAKNMNEMKPGERPDTIHLQGLPSKWFVSRRDRRTDSEKPNESVLQQVFGVFGEVRCADIPMLDPYRNKMKASISGIRTFSHETDAMFDAFVQYRDYICFVKAMDSLRGMKMVFKEGEKAYSASIKVDFDKTKHLSDMSIRRRAVEREKLMAKEREAEDQKRREEDAVKREMEAEQRKKLEEKRLKGERRKEREEKRKQRILKKLKKREAEQMNIKIAIEERKLLMAQRKLESIRLLDELFERVKVERQKEVTKQKELELDSHLTKVKLKNEVKQKKKNEKELRMKQKLMMKEKQLRKKLVNKIKSAQELQMEERREKLRKTIEGKVKMRTVIKNKDGSEIQADPEFERYDYGAAGYEYNPGYDPYHHGVYGGYGDWGHRGGYRGRFFPRRPFRGPRSYRGGRGGFHGDWWPQHSSEWEPPAREEKKTGADDIEDVSSDSGSSATSKYSNLGSSSDEKEKEPVKKETWPGYEANLPPEGMAPTHPWGGYSDYYNPRFMRRASRRPGGSFRGWQPQRGGYASTPNPNVPMNSFYMQSINNQYYRYFNRLTKGDDEKSGRSRSQSSERVVCRKVLSRSRSRGKSYSRSRSRSRSSRSRSRTRSRTRSRSKSRGRSRSHSRSRRSRSRRSKSRSRSRDRRSRSRERTKSNSPQTTQPEGREHNEEKNRPDDKVAEVRAEHREEEEQQQKNDNKHELREENHEKEKHESEKKDEASENISNNEGQKREDKGEANESVSGNEKHKMEEKGEAREKGDRSENQKMEERGEDENVSRNGKQNREKMVEASINVVRSENPKRAEREETSGPFRRSENPKRVEREETREPLRRSERQKKEDTEAKGNFSDNEILSEDKGWSDLSLSLSGSEDWTRGSPERKAKPLGDPNWEPSESRFRRGRNYGGYDRSFPHFRFEVRSLVTRPDRRSRSPSREQRSKRTESHRSRESGEAERRSRRSRSMGSRERRSRSKGSRERRSRSKSSRERQPRSQVSQQYRSGSRHSESRNISLRSEIRTEIKKEPVESEPSTSTHEKGDSSGSKMKRKKDKKRKDKSHGSSKHKRKSSRKDSPE